MAMGKHRAAKGNRVGRILLTGLIMLAMSGARTAYADADYDPDPPSSPNLASLASASVNNDSTPEFFFNLDSLDSFDTLRFQIQIDDTMDFSSPIVDYISAPVNQDAQSFTVGQAPGDGNYIIGSANQTLPDNQYYWRVNAIDNSDPENPLVVATSDSLAFEVDTSGSDVSSPPPMDDESETQDKPKPSDLATTVKPVSPTRHISAIPSNSPDVPASSDTDNPPPAAAVLNSFASYLDGSGQTLDMKEGQVLFFTHDRTQHSITLKSIHDGKVTLTVASTPFDITVSVDEIRTHDVDNDGRPDISIKLVSVTGDTAKVTFTQLVRSSNNAISVETSQPPSAVNWWLIAGGVALAALIACLIIRALRSSPRHRH